MTETIECSECGMKFWNESDSKKKQLSQHRNSIECQAQQKINKMEENGYVVVHNRTLLSKLKTQGKTKVEPYKFKTMRFNDHVESYPQLGHWVKKKDYEEAMEKYLLSYTNKPKAKKIYETDDYILCGIENGKIFKKITKWVPEEEISRKRKFRYTEIITRQDSKYAIYTLDGIKVGEEVPLDEVGLENKDKLRNRLIGCRL